jgi:ATP-binding protein involved in chromosome partitioning
VDPRPAVIERRLRGVRRIVAVTGGKGGIGKSSVAAGLALGLAADGARVGLLDLDLWGPSDHVILGVARPGLGEDGGLVPDVVAGVRFMSIASIVGDDPALLRGDDISNAILELLAVTIWDDLDVLVVDMPPGFGDTLLDSARYLPRAEYVVVTTPSELTRVTTRKTLELLRRLDLPVLGLVENLRRDGDARDADRAGVDGPAADRPAAGGDLRLLGSIGYDERYEASLGDPERLRGTAFYRDVRGIVAAVGAASPAAKR